MPFSCTALLPWISGIAYDSKQHFARYNSIPQKIQMNMPILSAMSTIKAQRRPDTEKNVCWTCDYQNISGSTECGRCGVQLIPSSTTKRQEMVNLIYAFGPHAEVRGAAKGRLRAALFEECMRILEERRQTAVFVGDGKNAAIVIHDADGTIRSSVMGEEGMVETLVWEQSHDSFDRICEDVLKADPNTGRSLVLF